MKCVFSIYVNVKNVFKNGRKFGNSDIKYINSEFVDVGRCKFYRLSAKIARR